MKGGKPTPSWSSYIDWCLLGARCGRTPWYVSTPIHPAACFPFGEFVSWWTSRTRSSWATWTRQIWPWSTKWSRAMLTEFSQENTLVITNTLFQQHKTRLYTWTSPDGQYQNQIDYILCSWRWRTLYNQQKQDQELTVAQIMNSLLPNSDWN